MINHNNKKLKNYLHLEKSTAYLAVFLACVTLVIALGVGFKNSYAYPFVPAANYPAGNYPYSVVAVDIDGVNGLDLAVADTDGKVSILLNNGTADFAAPVQYVVGTSPMSIFAADFNGDTYMDLVVANYSTNNNVSILLNNGSGVFAPAVNYSAGGYPRGVFAADLDGDGDMDLAVANFTGSNISILFNDGSGVFATPVNYTAGSGSSSIFAADLDGINGLDLAVANRYDNNVSILFNNGSGAFAAPVNYTAGDGPSSVFAADLNGINGLDLAVSNRNSNDVSILINNGSGGFALAETYTAGTFPLSIFAVNLDGDADMDLATANFNSGNVSILLNNGSGIFAAPVNYTTGNGAVSVFAAYLDGDTDIDLAIANFHSSNVSILLTAGALTSTNVEPASFMPKDSGTATVTFTTVHPIPNDGKIKVTFGAGFDVSGAAGGTCSTMDGTFVTSVSGQVVTLARQGDGTPVPVGAHVCAINSVINPGTAGSTGTYAIRTTTAGDLLIDIDSAVAYDYIVVGALTNTNVEPATLSPRASGIATVTFTTVHPIPNDGKIKVTFGAGFDVSGAAGGICSTMDGTFVTSVSGQVVTLARQGDGTSEPIGAQACAINTIINPGVGSTGTYAISTTKPGDYIIDTYSFVAADIIVAGALTDTNVEPATLLMGASGTATVTFTTATTLPNDGKIKVTFGYGFDVSGAAGGICSTMDGTFVTSVSGQVVTLTRQGDGTPEPFGPQACAINTIINPSYSGDTGTYTIITATSGDFTIDIDEAVAADIIPVGVLADTNVEPATLITGATGTATITFTTANTIPIDGFIMVTFGSGFNVTGALNGTCSTMDGTFGIYYDGQVVFLSRLGDGTPVIAGIQTCTIDAIVNQSYPGSTGTYIIRTATPDDLTIDIDEAVAADTMTAGITDANVEPATLITGATGTATITFTTANTIPNNGKIKVTFGNGFTITSAAGGTCSSMDGTFVTTRSGKTVIITRQGGVATAEPPGVQTCTINTMINQNYPGSTGTYTIATTTSDNINIDINSAVPADIMTAGINDANVEPATLVAGASGTATITFTTDNPIPVDGKIRVTFGTGFIVSGATGGTCSSMDGTFVTSVTGQAVFLTRVGISPAAAGVHTCTINTIKNMGYSGTTGAYTIATLTSASVRIDINSAVEADMIIPGSLTNTNVEPSTLVAGASGTATITFTTVNTIPGTGKIKITFGSGFNIASANGGTCSTMDGNFITAKSGNIVTITRQGGTSELPGVQTCTINMIVNPGISGSTGVYDITTTTSSNVVIDTDSAVSADSMADFINTATTADNSGNGQIDTIVLALNHDVTSDSITGTDFSITSPVYAVLSASRTDTSQITILLTESGVPDTNATPTVNIVDSITLATVGTDTVSLGAEVSIDGAAPTFSGIALGSDEYINLAEATAGVNIVIATTGVEDGQTVSCSITDVGSVHTVGPVTGTTTTNAVTIASGNLTSLDDGLLVATCTVSDFIGNLAIPGTDTATKDAVVPTFSGIALGSDEYINLAEATAGVNIVIATTGVEDGQTVSCSITDAGSVHTVGPVTGTTTTNAVTIASGNLTSLDDGLLVATCTVSDLIGNPAIPGTDTATKDAAAPTFSGMALGSDEYINLAEATAGVNIVIATTGVEDGQTVSCSITDVGSVHTVGPVTGTTTTNAVTIASGNLTSLDDGLLVATCTVSDFTGNPAIPGTDTATKVITAPTVLFSPVNGATGVDIIAPVVITFSEPMDTSTFTYTLTGTTGIVWTVNDTVATISHTAFSNSTPYTLTLTVATDIFGNSISGPSVATFITVGTFGRGEYDPDTPALPVALSISIAGGANQTVSKIVVLVLSATNAAQMMISNNSDFSEAVWETYATSKTWTLTDNYSAKTVYAKFKNTTGAISSVILDGIDYVATLTIPETEPVNLVLTDPTPAPALPAQVTVGALVKLTDMASVYFIDQDNRRHAFPNELVYLSYYPDFSGIQTISRAIMAEIPIGSNVTMRPGTYLVKIQIDPKVYAVEPYGVLKWLNSEQIAASLYGADWAKRVVDVDPTFFINYQVGSTVNTAKHPAGSAFSYVGDYRVYYVEQDKKRYVSTEAFINNKLQDKFIIRNVALTITYPDGPDWPVMDMEEIMTLR